MGKLKRFGRISAIVILVFLIILLIPLVGVGLACKPFARANPAQPAGTENSAEASAESRQITAGLQDYARQEEQTYLTLPEWYIVYSSDEYAAFVAQNPPSQFPYFQVIGQYWQSYYDVCAVTRDQYPFNSRYHTVLMVIGTSFTIENILKGSYEKTVGRVAEWLSSSELTEEDAYARQVAKEYGDFIHTIPWFEFPFGQKLKGLWNDTSLGGPNVMRKWERKFALSLEYGGKAIYGWLIKRGNETAFTPQDLEIQGWAKGISPEVLQREPEIRIVKAIDDQAAIVALPRYEAFTQLAPRLARQGVQFVELAGNDEILLTAIAPRDWAYDLKDGEFLFAMEILTQPDLKRIAVKAPVKSLHTILTDLEDSGVRIEHVYDY